MIHLEERFKVAQKLSQRLKRRLRKNIKQPIFWLSKGDDLMHAKKVYRIKILDFKYLPTFEHLNFRYFTYEVKAKREK